MKIHRTELIKRAGILKETGSIAGRAVKETLKGVNTVAEIGLSAANKVANKGINVLNTANNGKLKGFEERTLKMKPKDGTFVEGLVNRKHNKKVEAMREKFRGKSSKVQTRYVRRHHGEGAAKEHKKLTKERNRARGGILLTGGGIGGASHLKNEKNKENRAKMYSAYYNSHS